MAANAQGPAQIDAEIRAPMLESEQAKQAAFTPGHTGSNAVTTEDIAYHRISALSAVPTSPPPPDGEAWTGEVDLERDWQKYSLIAALVVAAGFLFWRLGERASDGDRPLLGYDSTAAAAPSAEQVANDLQGRDEKSYQSLRDAIEAMKSNRC